MILGRKRKAIDLCLLLVFLSMVVDSISIFLIAQFYCLSSLVLCLSLMIWVFVPSALLFWRTIVAGVPLDRTGSMVHSPGRVHTEHKANFFLVLGGFHLVYAACHTLTDVYFFIIRTSSHLVLFF